MPHGVMRERSNRRNHRGRGIHRTAAVLLVRRPGHMYRRLRKSILPIELWTGLRLLRNQCWAALPGHTHIDLQTCRLARRLERNAATTMLCGGHGAMHSIRRNWRLPVIHLRLLGKVFRLRYAVTDMLIREEV